MDPLTPWLAAFWRASSAELSLEGSDPGNHVAFCDLLPGSSPAKRVNDQLSSLLLPTSAGR